MVDGNEKNGKPTVAPDPKNIVMSAGDTMELERSMKDETNEAVLAEMERKKRARRIVVPTDDAEVKVAFRQMGEPICLFGEGPADRRERLREFLSLRGVENLKKEAAQQTAMEAKREQENVTWYHEGSEYLQKARYFLAKYSLPRAAKRLERERSTSLVPKTQQTARTQDLYKKLRTYTIDQSQIGDVRPISYCEFSPDSSMLATASWSGDCKLWDIPSCTLRRTLTGHKCQVGCITFNPQPTGGERRSSPEDAAGAMDVEEEGGAGICLASCSQDGAVKLWSLDSEEPIADIEGHAPHRVSRIQFHPSGQFLATCCFDMSWRLWDLEVQEEILHQEGHSKEVYCLSFQKDGALACTGGLDAYGRVWDLRTGRCVMFMADHLKEVLSVDFSPNGYTIASGSADNTCKVWDLRQQSLLYTIPAHTNLVSKVKFQPTNGDYILTSSYDCTAKLWAHPTGAPIKTLSGHEGKVMCADIAPDLSCIATASYDRTFKIWGPDSLLL